MTTEEYQRSKMKRGSPCVRFLPPAFVLRLSFCHINVNTWWRQLITDNTTIITTTHEKTLINIIVNTSYQITVCFELLHFVYLQIKSINLGAQRNEKSDITLLILFPSLRFLSFAHFFAVFQELLSQSSLKTVKLSHLGCGSTFLAFISSYHICSLIRLCPMISSARKTGKRRFNKFRDGTH